MSLFGRSAGYYIFWTGFVYFFTGMFNLFVYEFARMEFIQIAWIVVLALPLTVRPVAHYFNMRTLWERQ